jgi:hypothetical protein
MVEATNLPKTSLKQITNAGTTIATHLLATEVTTAELLATAIAIAAVIATAIAAITAEAILARV